MQYRFKSEYLSAISHKLLYVLLAVVATLLTPDLNAQVNIDNLIPHYFQQAPNSAALNKYGEYQVSLFTGVPEISIPLYTIKQGALTLPVTLSYHASGNKVTDAASWVGLGWSLNAGGAVSRKLMGARGDENSSNGYLHTDFRTSAQVDQTTEAGREYLGLLSGGTYDTEPDIFSVSAPTVDAKFFFDRGNGFQPSFLHYSPAKVTSSFISTADVPFNVLDEKGIKYRFGGNFRETTTSYNGGSSSTDVSSWMLESMSALNAVDEIDFSYSTQYGSVSDDLVDTWEIDDNQNQYEAGGFCSMIPNPSITRSIHVGSNVIQCQLQEITYRGGKVVFTLSNSFREDLTNFKSLASIQVYNLDVATNQYQLQKTILPFLSYFINGTDAATKRLRLDSLQILDNAGAVTERYSFAYDALALPAPTSKQRDFWGYYNGKNNSSLIPQQNITFSPGSGSTPQTIIIGSNYPNGRDADAAYAKACVLKRINYPTGGYTTFEYEGNQYLQGSAQGYAVKYAGGLRIHAIASYDGINAAPLLKTYEYNTARPNFIPGNQYFFTNTWHEDWYFNGTSLGWCSTNRRVYLSNPTIDFLPYDQAAVVYPTVTEYLGDATNNSGKTVYQFKDAADIVSSASIAKPIMITQYFLRGQLLNKSVYRNTGPGLYQIVKEERHSYDAFPGRTSVDVGLTATQVLDQSGAVAPADHKNNLYYYGYYGIECGDSYPIKNEVVTYDANDPSKFTIQTETNTYGNIIHQQVTRIDKVNSDGTHYISNRRFPADYIPAGSTSTANSVLNAMLNYNMQAMPIESWESVLPAGAGSTEVVRGGQLNSYTTNYHYPQPATIYQLENASLLNDYTASYVTGNGGLTFDSRYKVAVNFDLYDSDDHLVQYTPRNGAPVAMIWDYNGQLPVAEIKGAARNTTAYTSFEGTSNSVWTYNGTFLHNGGATGQSSFQGTISKAVPAGNYTVTAWALGGSGITVNSASGIAVFTSGNWTMYKWELSGVSNVTVSSNNMDEVRLYPTGAQMTTYTYTPTIGITSLSGPTGDVNYYEYDTYQRLKLIKDQKGNVIKTFDYKYNNKLPLQ
ncbi:hypothetical protein [Deminuibacter soli]|uniref:YD repeat-containing protein n=1 Tax=Deminuibacter soli TaxID=2291815 RepID=A0A3E1NIA1_9BACT|nr:hypothetical protein [Deminuibacter soli]RFM27667.1 hypothetical protein DXN05_13225 [Deminuibacter soli]